MANIVQGRHILIYFVECVSKIKHILSVIHYTICGAVWFQVTHFPCDDWENIYTLSYYHHQIGSMNYYPLFRVRSWNNDDGVRCMSFYILLNLWYGRIASWDIRVLVVFARIWPSATDMQHYYHARYPTDDWHLTYKFSLVYFSVEVCLEGMFPQSVSTRWDSCVRVRVYAPLMLAFPLAQKKKKNPTGRTQLSTWTLRPYSVLYI